MGRVNEKYQPQNTIEVLGRMLNFKVLQDKLAIFSKPPSLLGIDMNDQFMSLIELTSDHEDLKVISYAMEQLPLNTIINGDIKQPEIVNKYLVKLLGKASTKTKKIAIAVSGSSVITKVITMATNAIAAEGRGEIISQPRIITGDKQEAEIKSGEEIPYIESSASGRSTIKFREAVLSLSVRPSITADNRLILDLVIKQDSRSEDKVYGENNSQVPIILKNEIRTQALVDNGKTIVLGGIFRESELEQETKVPLLGDTPLLGRLFKRTIVGHQKNELLIFITPKILTDSVLD